MSLCLNIFIKCHLFPKNIHRIGFLDPRSHFSLKIFIGLDSSIRDLVNFGGRKIELTFSKILKNLKKRNLLRRILPRAVSDHLPPNFLFKIGHLFHNV